MGLEKRNPTVFQLFLLCNRIILIGIKPVSLLSKSFGPEQK